MNLNNTQYMDAVMYGPREEETSNFFMDKVQQLASFIPEQYNTLYNNIKSTAELVNSDYLRDVSQSLVSHAISSWQGDNIRALTTVSELQAAPPSARQWIMAQPTLRKLYHNQQCDGYSETYIDNEPGSIGMDHSQYRKVHHGVVQTEEDGSEYLTFYHSDMDDEDYQSLSIANKADIMVMWDTVEASLAKNRLDPSSPWCTYL